MSGVIGTMLDAYYEASAVQAVKMKAIGTLTGGDGGFDTIEEAAQAVLDLLVTAMQLGAFKDYEPRESTTFHFPPGRENERPSLIVKRVVEAALDDYLEQERPRG